MEKQKIGFVKVFVEYFAGDSLRQGFLVLVVGLVGVCTMLLLLNDVGAVICVGVAMVGLVHMAFSERWTDNGPRLILITVSIAVIVAVTLEIYWSKANQERPLKPLAPALQAWTDTGFVEKITPMSQELDFVTVWLSPSNWRQWVMMPAGRARVGQKVRLSTWAVDDNTAHYPGRIFYLATPFPYP